MTLDRIEALERLVHGGMIDTTEVGGGHGDVPPATISLSELLERGPVEPIAKIEIQAPDQLFGDVLARAVNLDVQARVHCQLWVAEIGQDASDPTVERLHGPNEEAANRTSAVALKNDAADGRYLPRPIGMLLAVRGHPLRSLPGHCARISASSAGSALPPDRMTPTR